MSKYAKSIDDLYFEISHELPAVLQRLALEEGSVWLSCDGFRAWRWGFAEKDIQELKDWAEDNRADIHWGMRSYCGLGEYPNDLNCSAVYHYFYSSPALYNWHFEPETFLSRGQLMLGQDASWTLWLGGSLIKEGEFLHRLWANRDNVVGQKIRADMGPADKLYYHCESWGEK